MVGPAQQMETLIYLEKDHLFLLYDSLPLFLSVFIFVAQNSGISGFTVSAKGDGFVTDKELSFDEPV